jgi:hypothetical protein
MATHPNAWSPAEAWRRFRLEAEAAKNYPLSYSMYIGQTHRDVLLERLLPALLYIKAVAILDDSLELWLDTNGHRLVSPYRNDLNGRLDYLKDNNLLGAVPSSMTSEGNATRSRMGQTPPVTGSRLSGTSPLSRVVLFFSVWRVQARNLTTIVNGLRCKTLQSPG